MKGTKERIVDHRTLSGVSYDLPMKRIKSGNKIAEDDKNDAFDTTKITQMEQNSIDVSQQKSEQVKKPKLNLKVLRNGNDKSLNEIETDNSTGNQEIVTLPGPNGKNKIRAVVNVKMMKEELKQLEDPPITQWEKKISSKRLPFEFFNKPCEDLAQHLLGKILVRYLENGTILKGRIVETEGYLGVIDKASHTYDNKITPRNMPMYMPPGTIYVYMTYGMYYCFNISSQESGAYVSIKAVEPLLGLDYMELLCNMRLKENKKEKEIVKNVKHYKATELCNNSFKICTVFFIEEDEFNQKCIYNSNSLWIENDPSIKSTTIVSIPSVDTKCSPDEQSVKLFRYYILGNPCVSEYNQECDGCAVLIRAVDPLEGIEHMAHERNLKTKSNASKGIAKDFKVHELCNGPSKLCISFQLHKSHSKYSLCTWKSLWLEEDSSKEEIKIVKSKRIGIDSYGPEWSNKLLRYYIYGNKSVSKRDKKMETLVESSQKADQ